MMSKIQCLLALHLMLLILSVLPQILLIVLPQFLLQHNLQFLLQICLHFPRNLFMKCSLFDICGEANNIFLLILVIVPSFVIYNNYICYTATFIFSFIFLLTSSGSLYVGTTCFIVLFILPILILSSCIISFNFSNFINNCS